MNHYTMQGTIYAQTVLNRTLAFIKEPLENHPCDAYKLHKVMQCEGSSVNSSSSLIWHYKARRLNSASAARYCFIHYRPHFFASKYLSTALNEEPRVPVGKRVAPQASTG